MWQLQPSVTVVPEDLTLFSVLQKPERHMVNRYEQAKHPYTHTKKLFKVKEDPTHVLIPCKGGRARLMTLVEGRTVLQVVL